MIFQQKFYRPEGNGMVKVMKGKKTLLPRILHPAKLSFRFDQEIKSSIDMQKAKRIQHHQTSFTTNARGTSLGEKEKATTRNKKITNEKAHQ